VIAVAGLLAALVVGGCALIAWLARREGRLYGIATPLAFGALILGLWQVVCVGFDVPRVLLPAPSAIALAFATQPPDAGGRLRSNDAAFGAARLRASGRWPVS